MQECMDHCSRLERLEIKQNDEKNNYLVAATVAYPRFIYYFIKNLTINTISKDLMRITFPLYYSISNFPKISVKLLVKAVT